MHPLNRNDLSDWVYLDPSDVYSVKDDVMKIITLPDYPKGSCVWTVKSTKTYSDPGLTQARNNGTTIPASQYLGKVKQALGVEVKLGMWKGMINVLQLDYSTPVYVMAQNTKVGACPGGGGTQPPNVSPGGPAIGPGSQTTTTPTANQSGISPVTIVIGAFVVGLAMLSSKK